EQVVQHQVQLLQGRLELTLVVGDETGDLGGDVVDAGDQVAQRLPPLVERGEQQVAVGGQLIDLTGPLRQRVRHVLGAGEKLIQCLVAGVEAARQVGDTVERVAQLGRGVFERIGQRLQRHLESRLVQRADVL